MIHKLFTIGICILFLVSSGFSQKLPYVIYNAKGKKVSYNKMLKVLEDKDILLFGELHNNPITHWLQYEVTADLHNSRQLIMGAEMLESDNQEVLNQYLAGLINYKQLDSLARLWPNYKTDYAPLVDFAKENQIDFVATNIPRRYANMVFKNGGYKALDSLESHELAWIAPLPIPFDINLPRYQNILDEMGDHATEELVKAQAIKDATMAHFILKAYQPGHLFMHYNGAYHSDFYEGILWYLNGKRTDLNYATLSTVSQEDIGTLLPEHLQKADFIICVDSDMTTSY
ncbi:MAG TPA: ChaN family lipoprotein [Saprospiraceae bacterium]|nr:ChaN family lipoprotein [Saprospiraceae bacterium]